MGSTYAVIAWDVTDKDDEYKIHLFQIRRNYGLTDQNGSHYNKYEDGNKAYFEAGIFTVWDYFSSNKVSSLVKARCYITAVKEYLESKKVSGIETICYN